MGETLQGSAFYAARIDELAGRAATSIATIDASLGYAADVVRAEARSERDRRIADLTAHSDGAQAVLFREAEDIADLIARQSPPSPATGFDPWDAVHWGSCEPTGRIPDVMSVGSLLWGELIVEALVPSLSNVLVEAGPEQRADAAGVVQGLMLRTLASVEPGQLKVHVIDPTGKGETVGAFMPLADDQSGLFEVVWKETGVNRTLEHLNERVATVQRDFLRGDAATLVEYNAGVGDMAEQFHMVVVLDAGTALSRGAFDDLVSLAVAGPRAGVFVVCVNDPGKDLGAGRSWHDIEANSAVLSIDGSSAQLQLNDFTVSVTLSPPPPGTAISASVEATRSRAIASEARPIDLARYVPDTIWSESTIDGIRVPIGATGTRTRMFEANDTTPQSLLIGATGSGKSTLLHTLIHSAAARYSPDELELYLVDLKEGTEFFQYAPSVSKTGLPHIKVVACDAEPEFALSVLQELVAVCEQRGKLLHAAEEEFGIPVTDFHDYRSTTQRPLPRVLAVIDEFHMLLKSDDNRLTEAAWTALDYIARMGRSFGVHLILASQSLGGLGLHGAHAAAFNQFKNRIALNCSAEDSKQIFGEDNPAAASLSRQGEAIYNDRGGVFEANERFRVAFAPGQELLDLRRRISEQPWKATEPPVVFDGDALGYLNDNSSYRAAKQGHRPHDTVRFAWLGTPIRVRGDAQVGIWPARYHNLAVIGQKATARNGVLASATRSIAVQHPRGTVPYLQRRVAPIRASSRRHRTCVRTSQR